MLDTARNNRSALFIGGALLWLIPYFGLLRPLDAIGIGWAVTIPAIVGIAGALTMTARGRMRDGLALTSGLAAGYIIAFAIALMLAGPAFG